MYPKALICVAICCVHTLNAVSALFILSMQVSFGGMLKPNPSMNELKAFSLDYSQFYLNSSSKKKKKGSCCDSAYYSLFVVVQWNSSDDIRRNYLMRERRRRQGPREKMKAEGDWGSLLVGEQGRRGGWWWVDSATRRGRETTMGMKVGCVGSMEGSGVNRTLGYVRAVFGFLNEPLSSCVLAAELL